MLGLQKKQPKNVNEVLYIYTYKGICFFQIFFKTIIILQKTVY